MIRAITIKALLERLKVKMAKNDTGRKKISWMFENDGLQPGKSPWGFVILNPLAAVVPPGATRELKMEVKCSHPLIAFPVERRAAFLSVKSIIYPNQMITATVENNGVTPLLIDEREALINVYPLIANDITDIDE